jgi:hypothetical protein
MKSSKEVRKDSFLPIELDALPRGEVQFVDSGFKNPKRKASGSKPKGVK